MDRALAGDEISVLQMLGLTFIVIAQQSLGVLATYLTELLGWAATNQVQFIEAREIWIHCWKPVRKCSACGRANLVKLRYVQLDQLKSTETRVVWLIISICLCYHLPHQET